MAIDADREEREPTAAQSLGPILPPAAPRPTLPGPREPVLFSDKSDSSDLLGVAEAVRPLAELCLAPEAQTPFLAGIVGPSGAGKSFALRRLVGAIDALANAAAKTPGGPFLSRIVIASVDAAGVSADPASALAAAAFVALERDRAGVSYPALADEAAHATTDPRRAALAAADRLDEIVRRLETERVAREEVEAKRARLAELLLYETPGSRVNFSSAPDGPLSMRGCGVSVWARRTRPSTIAISCGICLVWARDRSSGSSSARSGRIAARRGYWRRH